MMYFGHKAMLIAGFDVWRNFLSKDIDKPPK